MYQGKIQTNYTLQNLQEYCLKTVLPESDCSKYKTTFSWYTYSDQLLCVWNSQLVGCIYKVLLSFWCCCPTSDTLTILKMLSPIKLKPSFTIMFKMCAQQRIWNLSPNISKDDTSFFAKRVSAIALSVELINVSIQ